MERSYLLAALERCGGVRTRAAGLLKMTYRSFRHYVKNTKSDRDEENTRR